MKRVKKEVDPRSEEIRLYLTRRTDWVSQRFLSRYFAVSKGKVTTLLKKNVKLGVVEELSFHESKYYRTPKGVI